MPERKPFSSHPSSLLLEIICVLFWIKSYLNQPWATESVMTAGLVASMSQQNEQWHQTPQVTCHLCVSICLSTFAGLPPPRMGTYLGYKDPSFHYPAGCPLYSYNTTALRQRIEWPRAFLRLPSHLNTYPRPIPNELCSLTSRCREFFT